MIHSFFRLIRLFWWNKSVQRWAIISLMAYKAIIGAADEEPPTLKPVYEGQWWHMTFRWLSNGQLEIDNPTKDWYNIPQTYLYSPSKETLAPRLSTLVSSSGLSSMVQSGKATSQQGEVYLSPDGRFIVYSLAPEPDQRRTYLAMMDLVKGQEFVFREHMLTSAYQFYIEWGSGSNAFILRTWGDYGYNPYPTYIGGFAEDITKARVVLLGEGGPLEAATQWGVYHSYDLDSTGKYLLADGYLYKPEYEPRFMRLLVINMEDFSYTIAGEARHFEVARFEQPGDQRVFFVTDIGIYSYHRETMKRTLLTKSDEIERIFSTVSNSPLLSPDGHYLATYIRTDSRSYEEPDLYVIPIPPAP